MPATSSDGDEVGSPSTDLPVPVDDSVIPAPPPVSETSTEREPRKRRSDRLETKSSVTARQKPTAAATGATGTSHPDSDVGARSLAQVTRSGATDIVVARDDAGVETVAEMNVGALGTDISLLPLSASPDADNKSAVVARSGDPIPSPKSIDVVSGLLSVVGLGMPLAATDGPVAPPPAVILAGSLDLVRRDLERAFNDQPAGDTQQITTNALITDAQADELVPVALTAASESGSEPPSSAVPLELTVDPTSAERTAAFEKEQAERTEAFTEAQAARTEAFNEQVATQSPLEALVGSAAFVVSELANTAAFVVTEFVNYISFAVTEFIHGISDWFTAPEVFTGLYGDPTTNAQYWQAQSSKNCVLMSTAMIINQLKQTPNEPDEEDIVKEAQETDSVANPGKKMYQGLQSQDGVNVKDAMKLLDNHGISATLTEYDKTEGNQALRAVAFALEEQKAVSVGLHGGIIWNSVDPEHIPEDIHLPDHQVVVTGVDFTERVVYLNDSGFAEQGRNLKIPLDAFMKAWQVDNYETIIAELKEPNTSSSGPESASLTGSGVLINVA
ncbi:MULTISPECIES: hypothetical protein [unclassified Mycobacterium]|uniref:hypothetical protein n=1 Tax=unclassified Mycobacterium TaxID=2642494 RepID=UPI0012E33399|nr:MULTISPECIES: hypothetical protein [unclassified Mycobacterium]